MEDGAGSQKSEELCVLNHHLLSTWFLSKKLLTSAQLGGCQYFGGQLPWFTRFYNLTLYLKCL